MRAPVAAGILVLSACRDPAPPPPVVETAAAPVRPAAAVREKGKLTAIDITALFPLQQSGAVLLYDARPGFVAGFGKIPGSISWPKSRFDARLSQSEAEIRAAAAAGKPVVLYCTDAACPDARAVAEKLAARGHDVSVLDGGFAAWKEAGLPTE